MRYTQFTKEELQNMSLADLKKVDIYTVDEEKHIQILMGIQLEKHPNFAAITPLVFHNSITDGIKTKERELELQKEMDDYNETMKRNLMGEMDEPEEIESAEEDESEAAIEPQSGESLAEKKYCEFCDSKGGAHKKVCTRNLVAA